MILNCIIIDDEPLARKGLKEYIADVDFLNLVGEFDNPLKATQALTTQQVHLLFLDIHMPKISGIDFLKTLQHPPLVVLTTAFPQYALEGFDLSVLDYLLKPISFDRFFKAVLKARDHHQSRHAAPHAVQEAPKDDYIFIKADNKLVKLAYNEIVFVEALQNYVAIHTHDKKHITYLTFKSIEESLPAEQFIKVHKSYLVAVSKIGSIEGNEIIADGHHIPISRNLKEEVMEKLLKGRFLKR
ncbi:MAG TPA: LytTR family DNA-binding domain-containing protein [Chitinophagaceae bacterium]|nr:LytTR family DNA-binding domain-containing protein [Chitinophagaceae bacterium]